MTTTLFRGALACALLTSTALTAPALAQSPPPVNHNVDDNGIDVVLGRFELSQTLVSIGPPWPHGLHYTRIRDDDRWVDNFTGGIYQVFNQLFVSIGNSSAKFIYSGGNSLFTAGSFTPARADGSTLTRSGGVFTFTNSRGEIARFTAEITSTGHIVLGTGRVMDMRYPNGALVTLNYRTESVCDENEENCIAHFRIQSVTNNFSYQLHFSYAENGPVAEADPGEWQQVTAVRAINTAVESCDPYADQCTLTGAWPTASLGSASGYETVTLPDGNVWRYAAGTSGLTAIRRPGSSSDDVTISYGSPPDTVSVTGAAGTSTYAFSNSGATRTTTVAGPLGTGRTLTSDIDRQIVLADQDALGQTTSYQYDGNDRITRITAPEGNYAAFTYDGRGNVTEQRVVAKSGSGLSDIVATATYPSSCTNQMTCNQPSAVTDARGNTTDFTYDSSHGGAVTVTAAAPTGGAVRPQTRIGYTSASVGGETVRLPASVSQCQTQSSCSAAADEAVGSVSYSGANFLPTGVSRGNGSGTLTATSAIAYDDIGNVQTIDGPLSGSADTIRYRYNAARQTVGAVGPDPDGGGSLKHRAQRTTYDGAGLPIVTEVGTVNSQSDSDWAAMTALERVETERDGFGRPIVQRLVSGSTTYALTQTGYDAAGRPRCAAQRMNPAEFATASLPSDACTLDSAGSFGADRITRTGYDAAGRINLVETGVATGDAASEIATTYSNNGQVATLTDAEGNRTTYEYDGFDRLRNTRFPSPTTDGVSAPTSGTGADYEQYGYDDAGNLVSRRVRSGGTIILEYDNLNRLTLKNAPGNDAAEFDVTYAYDNLGRMLSATAATGSVTGYGYDALGRVTSESGPFGTNAMRYDIAGRMTRLTWPDSFYVDYVYDAAGAVIAIRENGATSGAGVLATFAYDDRGRRTSLSRGNGRVTGYSYDDVSRLTGMTQDLSGTSSDLTLGFGHNPAGQIASNSRSN
ncbi:MAG: hypothetical protein QOG13_1414, partial [Sphingomonadales bacterium]|nr:hypothetical protein [Sphingomonadales bacterium]